jgi:ubiquinone biosynthesis protein Coq4
MQVLHPNPNQALAGLRAMRMLGEAHGTFGAAARNLLDAVQKHILRTDYDLDALTPITPEELGAAFDNPALARQFAQGMTVISLAEGPPTKVQGRLMTCFAKALGVDEPVVKVLRELAEHHMVLFRLDFMRRSHLADAAKISIREKGFVATAKEIAAFRGMREDFELAARYEGLERLPADTLGYAFYRHCRDHGFAFPGERLGFPEAGIYHDFTHVLSGYRTDPAGELQVGGFTGGYKTHNPIFVILFVMLTFSAGINMTPLDQPNVHGILATEGLADKFLAAVERGGQVVIDLSDRWDHWAWVEKPLEQVRAQLRIAPLDA